MKTETKEWTWAETLEEALHTAKKLDRPVYVDFFNPD